jgi:hypothetical protein
MSENGHTTPSVDEAWTNALTWLGVILMKQGGRIEAIANYFQKHEEGLKDAIMHAMLTYVKNNR